MLGSFGERQCAVEQIPRPPSESKHATLPCSGKIGVAQFSTQVSPAQNEPRPHGPGVRLVVPPLEDPLELLVEPDGAPPVVATLPLVTDKQQAARTSRPSAANVALGAALDDLARCSPPTMPAA